MTYSNEWIAEADEDEDSRYWYFCSALYDVDFLDREDGCHSIERELRKAAVIDDTCKPDAEFSTLWIYFKTAEDGYAFIERLNAYIAFCETYIEDRMEAFREARAQQEEEEENKSTE